ncbi:MAG: hypothetical protein LUG61_09140 [Lachnospiraceae bacterium]|nr:hypothetical protein [Lachnospiraceae bacterium]
MQNYLPFYMSFPIQYPAREEDVLRRDMDYLRGLYPSDAQKYLKKIRDIIDYMDYEGSMIYDEYPDRWQLYRLAESIVKTLQTESENEEEKIPPQKWEWVSDLVQVLLPEELLDRRQRKSRTSTRTENIRLTRTEGGIARLKGADGNITCLPGTEDSQLILKTDNFHPRL